MNLQQSNKCISDLRVDFEELKKIAIAPQNYLRDFFTNLRNQVDRTLGQEEAYHQIKVSENEDSNVVWNEIINRIDSLEKESLSKEIDQEKIDDIRKKIEFIELKLNSNYNLYIVNDLEDSIFDLELIIANMLFSNKTIIFLDKIKFENSQYLTGVKLNRLLILNDEYITRKGIKQLCKK